MHIAAFARPGNCCSLLWLGAWLSLAAPAVAETEAAVSSETASAEVGKLLERQLDTASSRLARLYELHEGRPLWQDPARVTALVEALRALKADGLVPGDYRPDRLEVMAQAALGDAASVHAKADMDMLASRTLLTALTHLQRGKVDPRRLDANNNLEVAPADLDLAAISQSLDQGDVEAVFDQARPSYKPYEQLRQGLARYRRLEEQGGWSALEPAQDTLRPGDSGESVAQLRQRLAAIGNSGVVAADASYYPAIELQAPDPRAYDEALVDAVKGFQRRHLLAEDGVVGPRTLEALNISVQQRIDQIRANMERARWWLHGLPESFVLVDIAGYDLRYFRPNGETWRTRTVVGQPGRRTPTLRSEITHLTINPTWTIPPTIMREDVLPEVRQDLDYLQRQNLTVLSPGGETLEPEDVDWSNPGGVMLRQPAGSSNPLGQLVVRFPNDQMIYLHDTPSRWQFGRSARALSSGCIRVEGVMELAQLLFEDTDTRAEASRLVASGQTRNVLLARHVPVVLHYWTVQPAPAGELTFRPDIYERDPALIAALEKPPTR
ncbi:L,D-transpeptidase family protein [Halomonas sp. 18H]|uniref:L,D-transpeptidase family protein n=1 Tax=Halomonas almeriensis TaxID=308163 RepID=UPI00223060EF|nr:MULTISPECIES: L,D-transpeptidase family protein [Halomonas]MCW4149288.1 L,D-transpeptidase family protein [Halomonas sp. 18H]MDN3552159.1 L,D-transpeptidase family protein [Halomonas almeriensis]